MAAKCVMCSAMSGTSVFYQKCSACSAVFCPGCNDMGDPPYRCPKCKSNNVSRYPGTESELADLILRQP